MSGAHAKSDDDFDDGFELDADAFDAIEAFALTQKPPAPHQVPAAIGQPAPAVLLAAPPSSDDTFSDDPFVLDEATLDALDDIEADFEAAQQQQRQRQQQQQPGHGQATPPTNTLPTVPAPASAPAPVLPPSSPPAASSPTLAQPTTAKSSLKRQHSATSDAALPRKRARTAITNAAADAREATLRKLIDELECLVCLQHIVCPHNLPACGHCACAPCIDDWFLARLKAHKKISCPVCRDSLPRSTQPMPAYMLRECAEALVPHLSPDESRVWHKRTAEWKPGEWTWEDAYDEIDNNDAGNHIDDNDAGNHVDYSGEDDDGDDDGDEGDDDGANRSSDDDDHGTVIRVTALVGLT